jgi:betaine reductase
VSGAAQRVSLIAKGSLFLGRMSELSDGMSVLLEANNGDGG